MAYNRYAIRRSFGYAKILEKFLQEILPLNCGYTHLATGRLSHSLQKVV
jgi:hypothetical protein